MRDKGKNPVDNYSDFNYSAPEFICQKHPIPTPIGVCPLCLRERLNNLVCSVCGEPKITCFCSDLGRNSSSSDVGSVGRISFLIENEKQLPCLKEAKTDRDHEKPRSSSKTSGLRSKGGDDHEVRGRKSGFWRIIRMFKKKREKGSESKSEMWVLDHLGVSRSRSLCSFRESSSDFTFSSAKISDFNSSSERASNFSEVEPRKSSFKNRGLRECDFKNMDESAFIDLKLDLEIDDSKSDIGTRGLSRFSNFSEGERKSSYENRVARSETGEFGNIEKSGLIELKLDLATRDVNSDLRNRGIGELRGGSCRVTERDKTGEFKREKKGGLKVWRWILKHNPNWRSRSHTNRDCDMSHVIRP